MVDHEDNSVVVESPHDYDTDDVSYRLRLLAKNSYFLPPAHLKPNPAELSPLPPKKNTGFLDFFRSKSKPNTPPSAGNQGFENLMPALRTTSDATYVVRQDRAASLPQSPVPPSQGRVVVVREKLSDLASAAKQAEIEIKVRNARREREQNPPLVIDPTDTVDLPPSSSGSLFAVQASALSGLGVQDSLGAAVLADCLPPPRTPGGYDPEDEWRKALLKAAVGHSFDSIHAASMPSTPTPPNRIIDQRIISQPIAELKNQPPTKSTKPPKLPPTQRNSPPTKFSSKLPTTQQNPASRPSTTIPRRAETPSAPLMPLTPAPRKLINPLYSLSQTDLPAAIDVAAPPPPLPEMASVVVKVEASSENPGSRMAGTISPPLPVHALTPSTRTSQEAPSLRTASFESYNDGVTSTNGRPSLSEYSQASPTVSAFHDAVHAVRSSLNQPRQNRTSTESRISATQRQNAISPPPRVSSSTIPPLALSPPPRSSSLQNRLAKGEDLPEKTVEVLEILAPEPTTPPLEESGTVPSFSLLSIDIPSGAISPPSIRSAPPPSGPSTPSFFDVVQMQPNALDDLDSSDESDSDDDEPQQTETQSLTSRDRLMRLGRLGNHSTPHLRPPAADEPPPLPSVDPKQAIGHVSKPAPFFSQKISGKSEDGHGPPSSTFDIYKYTRRQPSYGGSKDIGRKRAATPPPVFVSIRDDETKMQAKDSLKKLDNMLLQHMAAEKSRFKQIANNAASGSQER